MPIILDGVTLNNGGTVTFDGNPVKEIVFGTTTVWKAEQTVFSNVNVATANTGQSVPYDSKTAYSAEYSFNFSDFSSLKITGQQGFYLVALGSYAVENAGDLEYKIGSGNWANLYTLGSGYDNSTVMRNVDHTIDISGLSGSGKLRLRAWARNSNIGETSSGRAFIDSCTVIAQ